MLADALESGNPADTSLDFPPDPFLVRMWVNGVPSASLSAILRGDLIFVNGFELP